MNQLSIKRLGLAFGMTGGLLYIGCALVMLLLGHDSTVKFFNILLHGIDISSVIRMNVSFIEALFGFIQTFILCWLTGACIAAIYNISLHKKIIIK